MQYPEISILIVNYNGAHHLPACLDSLKRQTFSAKRFEVLIVDNHSSDQSIPLLRSSYPWCRLIPLASNHGFAQGNNIGIHFARGKRIVLLNNDTIADPHWLRELIRISDRHPTACIASKLVFAHQPEIINSTGLFLLRDGRGADRGFGQRDRGEYEASEATFAACGAAMLWPRPLPGEKLFDSRYFVYCEDLDAGWQGWLQDRPTIYAPRALVQHVHSGTAGTGSSLYFFSVERNRALTSLRNGDLFLAVFSSMVLLGKVLHTFLLAIIGSRSSANRWMRFKATSTALASYLFLVPMYLLKRYQVRSFRKNHVNAGAP